MRIRHALILILLGAISLPAQAGILFGRKKEKIDPKQRVPELLTILRSDGDADKRARAAEELRNFDPLQHAEIVPALINALKTDARPSVRVEAVQTLAKIRPVTQAAGDALEQALATDTSMRVRLQARTSLLGYHWAGYKSVGKKADTPLSPGPLGTPAEKTPPVVSTKPTPPTPAPATPAGYRPVPMALTKPTGPSTSEPPLAPPLAPDVQIPLLPPPSAPAEAKPPVTVPVLPPATPGKVVPPPTEGPELP